MPKPTPRPTVSVPYAESDTVLPELPALLHIGASPKEGWAGEAITLTLRLQAKGRLSETTAYGALPEGLIFDEVLEGSVAYLSEEHALLWVEGEQDDGNQQQARARFLIAQDAPDIMELQLQLTSPGYSARKSNELTLHRRFGSTDAQIDPAKGGTLRSADGRVEMVFPAGAVRQSVRVEHLPLRTEKIDLWGEPFLQFELNAFGAEDAPVESFDEPIELRVNMAGLADRSQLGYYHYLSLVSYDDEAGSWQPIPTTVRDNVLIAKLEHFSIYGLGSISVDDTGWVPLGNEPQVSTYTGAMSYAVPIKVPQGRGGLTPSVNLTYNSGRVNGILTAIQTDWVGLGWAIDSIEISREVDVDYDGNSIDLGEVAYWNRFTLLLNGATHRLVPIDDTDRDGRYRCEEESYLYIERVNGYGANIGSPENHTTEYWIIKDANGTEYRLGYNEDSEQTLQTNEYTDGQAYGCKWSSGNPPSSAECYAGERFGEIAFRWRVDTITDTLGNHIDFSYSEEECDTYNASNIPEGWRETASYLETIEYNHVPGVHGGQGLTEIEFVLDDRDEDAYTNPCGDTFWFQEQYLDGIVVKEWDGTSMVLVAGYDLDYGFQTSDDSGARATRQLSQTIECGLGGITGTNTLPEITFDYDLYANNPNDGSGNPDHHYARLVTITNPYDGEIVVEYETRTDVETQSDDIHTYRVKEIEVTAGEQVEGGHKIAYTYPTDLNDVCMKDIRNSDNLFCEDEDHDEWGLPVIGYKFVTETLKALDNTVISSVRHDFHKPTSLAQYTWVGREHTTRYYDAGDTILKQITTTWYVQDTTLDPGAGSDGPTYFVWPRYTGETVAEDGVLPADAHKTTTYGYEASMQGGICYGNLTSVTDRDEDGDIVHHAATWYTPATSAWIINKPYKHQTFDSSQALIAESRHYYDSASLASAPTRGLLTKEEQLESRGPDTYITSGIVTYTQQSGVYVPTSEQNALGTVTEVGYDAYSRRPVTVTQDSSGANLVTVYEYGYDSNTKAMGAVTQVTDPNSVATYYHYDVFGRLDGVIKSGDSDSYRTVEYDYGDGSAPLAITTTQRIDTSNVLRTIDYYNGLGQVIQSHQVPTDTSSVIVTDYVYNAQGQQAQASLPYELTYSTGYQTPSGTYTVTTDYDALGRPIKVTNPDETEIETSYEVYTTTVIDANDHVRATGSDPFGRVVRVVEYSGTAPSHTEYSTTEYAYDERDLLTDVTDEDGNEISITYDPLGRKTAMSDPDMGDWSYAYDDAGNLVRQEDARGQVTFFAYDALGRLLGKEYCHGDCDTVPASLDYDIQYHYDNATVGHYGKGRLHYSQVHGEDTLESIKYDARGNVIQTYFGIDYGSGYVYTDTYWTYNSADMAKSQRYETSSGYETVSMGYDPFGRPDEMSGADDYVTGTTYDIYGRSTLTTFGDNNRTAYYFRDPDDDVSGVGQGGRLHYYQTGTVGDSDAIQYMSYQYDAVGNIVGIWDVNNPIGTGYQSQSFAYDALDRLSTASTSSVGSGQYDLSYTYDEIGNLTQVTDNDASSSTTYGYGGGSAPTHAISTANSSQVAWYDDNGNMTMSTWPGEDRRALVYDAENRLTYAAVGDASSSSWVTAYGSGVSAGSWTTQNAYPRMLADVNGDGKQDMVGFHSSYVYVSLSNGSTFASPSAWTSLFTSGWTNQDTYPRLLGDVDNDGDDDIVGFKEIATEVSLSSGSGFGTSSTWCNDFARSTSYGGYTTFDSRPRALGDVDGDGYEDVVGFISSGVEVGTSSGSGFGSPTSWSTEFGAGVGAGSWTSYDDYPRLVGDVDGDGKADIVGFKDEGAWVALSDGSGFDSAELWLGWFANDTDAGDWDSFDDNPRVLADMNGDGRDDIVGFKSPGVWVSLSVGDRFLPPSVWVDDYSADSSWGDFDDEPRMAGDLTGDGRAEFAGCASTGVVVYGHDTYLDFGYNADGIMASATISDTGGVTTTTYVGDHQEWVGSKPTNYYFHNGRRVAMSVDGGDPIYMHADHLQSTSNTSGDTTSDTQYYYPYGGTRGGSEVATEYRYTGQRWQSALGLYYYRARWYDPAMRRFVQADTIVPEPGNPQSLNRYAYCLNNPVRYSDPSGHFPGIELLMRLSASPLGQDLVSRASQWWSQAQALWVQLGPSLMQGAQDWSAQGPALIDKAGQTGRALRRAADQAGNTAGPGGLDPNDPFRGSSNAVQHGVETLRKQIASPTNWTTGRYGAQAHLSRAEYYQGQGVLESVNPVGPGTIDLTLQGNVGVEVKYWSAEYLSNNVAGLATQIKGFASLRLDTITIEFVATRQDPVSQALLQQVQQQLANSGVNISNIVLTTVSNPGIP